MKTVTLRDLCLVWFMSSENRAFTVPVCVRRSDLPGSLITGTALETESKVFLTRIPIFV